MQNSHTCPKCHHNEVYKINEVATLGADDNSTVPGDTFKPWQPARMGHVQAYVCAKCEYTEFYSRRIRESELVQRLSADEPPPTELSDEEEIESLTNLFNQGKMTREQFEQRIAGVLDRD